MMWNCRTTCLLLALTALAGLNDAAVPTVTQDYKVYGSDTAWRDSYGWAVSISGTLMAATAERDDDGGWDVGAVYLNEFINGTWVESFKIVPSSLDYQSNYGHALALEGNLLFVGVTGVQSVYVYDRLDGTNTWVRNQVLSGTTGFGYDLDLSGSTAVVASSADDDVGTNAGALYIFDRVNGTEWVQATKIYGSDATGSDNPSQPGDGFSMSVAIDGDVVVRGSPLHDGEASNAGAAYVFHRHENGTNAWGQVSKLTAPDAAPQDGFGADVGISGDVLAIGATSNGGGTGAVYIFYRHLNGTDSWGHVTKKIGEGLQPGSYFGRTLALVEDALVVAAPHYDANSGAAYIFHRHAGSQDAWGQLARFRASSPGSSDSFSGDLSMSDGIVAVGCYHEDLADDGEGSVFLYHGWSANETGSVCGDGILYYPEECEDGNVIDGDGCDSNCTLEECGNGVLQNGEECDDNNTAVADGCDSSCRIEVCGNGFIQTGETCDDGNLVEGDGCTTNCTIEVCGDGVLHVGEECDDNNTIIADGCDENCIVEVCGNDVVQAAEECDDGNILDGDGCAFNCTVEADNGAAMGAPTVYLYFTISIIVTVLLVSVTE